MQGPVGDKLGVSVAWGGEKKGHVCLPRLLVVRPSQTVKGRRCTLRAQPYPTRPTHPQPHTKFTRCATASREGVVVVKRWPGQGPTTTQPQPQNRQTRCVGGALRSCLRVKRMGLMAQRPPPVSYEWALRPLPAGWGDGARGWGHRYTGTQGQAKTVRACPIKAPVRTGLGGCER